MSGPAKFGCEALQSISAEDRVAPGGGATAVRTPVCPWLAWWWGRMGGWAHSRNVGFDGPTDPPPLRLSSPCFTPRILRSRRWTYQGNSAGRSGLLRFRQRMRGEVKKNGGAASAEPPLLPPACCALPNLFNLAGSPNDAGPSGVQRVQPRAQGPRNRADQRSGGGRVSLSRGGRGHL